MSGYDFSWMKKAMPQISEWVKDMWKKDDSTKHDSSDDFRLGKIEKHLRAAHSEMMIAVSEGSLSKEVFDKYRIDGSILVSLEKEK